MRSATGAAAVLVAAAIFVAPPAWAQRPVTRSIFIEATDADGRLLTDLAAEEVELLESGVKRRVTRLTPGSTPMRIVLLVDSSTRVAPMIGVFKNAITAFIDALPEQHEVAFVSSGGQIRVRTQPGTDRARLKAEAERFAAEGGANAFLETLLEADNRFLKPAPALWPVFVILTTDNGENRREVDVAPYNRFMNDFRARGGAAHAVIVQGRGTGPVMDYVSNLVDNVSGTRATVHTEYSLPERLKEIAERIAFDHETMAGRYEVAFDGDPKILQPVIAVSVKRDNARVVMSVRRPF